MRRTLKLFEAVGVELEYMIVDKETLMVNPISDLILKEIAGEITSDVEYENLEWSNELVLHVIELKTGIPASNIADLDIEFHKSVKKINSILDKYNSMLLPTGAHPFMNPFTETKLWPHNSNEVYSLYNKIFDCRGHGWSNLQSTHINLPFGDDLEFGRLHAAIRLILPLIPALAASTPIFDGKLTGIVDSRLEVYRNNQIKIPSIAGNIIPEQVFTKSDYENVIFKKIFNDIKPFDDEKILQHEWLNSRGAIARFSRNSIEIRIVDIQEAPIADIAIVEFFNALLKVIINEELITYQEQKEVTVNQLSSILLNTIKYGEDSVISDKDYLSLFGKSVNEKIKAGELLNHIYQTIITDDLKYKETIQKILKKGSLSNRIIKAVNNDLRKENLIEIYKLLAKALEANKLFEI